MRGTFSILVLVAAAAAGLYFLARPDAPETAPTETTAPSPGGSDSGAAPSTARTDPATPAPAAPEPDSIEAEAAKFVERLAEPTPQPVPIEQADHFVTQEQPLSLVPEEIVERVPVHALAGDETLEPETPITVVREVEQVVIATPEQLIAEAGGDLEATVQVPVEPEQGGAAGTGADAEAPGDVPAGQEGLGIGAGGDAETPVRVVAGSEPSGTGTDGNVETPETAPVAAEAQGGVEASDGAEPYELVTVRELLERMSTDPGKPISIIKKVRHFEVTTLGDLLDDEEDPGTFLNVIKKPYRIEAATLADLLQQQKSEHPDSIFYVRTVRSTDEQGIWGIVHSGLTDNFARGMAVRRGEQIETYTVRIPPEADEMHHDRSSSFLGRLIHRKTRDSFVYNFRENRMGQNPDHIRPGQEIVIINFEPEELIAIYKHFTGDRG